MCLGLFLLIIPSVLAQTALRTLKADGLVAVVLEIPAQENQGFRLLDVEAREEGDHLGKHWQDTFSLMMNGCFFDTDFKPVGVYKLDGELVNDAVNPSFSGVVTLDREGRLDLLTKQDDWSTAWSAFQTRPYVIDPGGKIGIHSDNGRLSERCLIGRKMDGTLVFVATNRISLYRLALILQKEIPGLERMLNMDGGPSSAFKVEGYERRNRSPVRSYLVKVK